MKMTDENGGQHRNAGEFLDHGREGQKGGTALRKDSGTANGRWLDR